MRGICTRPGRLAVPMNLILAVITAVWLVSGLVYGQVLYGSIVGNVVDQNKATVPGATVVITNKATGQVRETITNNEGEYSITNILSGTYDIKVTKQGFTSFTQTALTITANNITRMDVEMKIGNVSDVVSVTAAATVLQTESATVKSEISSKEINALPLANYRNYQSLINLVPGTTPALFQNAQTDTPEMSLTTNVNGTPRNNNNTRLDGATSVNIWLPHHTAYVPPSESIMEVNISTNNFDAEQGLAGGAAVQVITKSGGNQFHGSGFIYHDNHLFRAKNFFQPASVKVGTTDVPTPNKPKSLRTINGATFGGPIKKDKLFFFGSWESQDERMIADGRFTVPTLDQRAGNFSAFGTTIYDPNTGNIDGTGRTPFANATIPDDRISPISKKLLALIPLANLPGTTANYYNSAPFTSDRNNFDAKMNWNRNTNHQVWWKFSHMRAAVTAEFALGAAGGPGLCIGTCGSGTGDTKSYVGSAGHTWTLGNGFLIDGNFSVTQRNQQVLGPDYGTNFGLEVLGIPGTNGPDIRQSGFPQFNFTNNTYTGLGNQNNWSPTFRDERSYTFTQNATKIHGSHDLRFGADVVRHELNHWQPEIGVGPRGAFNFTGSETALRGGAGPNQFNQFAAFLLGMTNNVQKSLQFELMTTREWQMGFFFRDRWQVSRNLTLTLGLRYELYPIMHRADRGIELLDLNSPVQLGANGLPNGNMKVLIGDRGSNESSLGVTSSKKLVAPRLGLAYRVGDDMVIRSGYGITYDPMPFGRPLRGFYPLTIAQTFVSTAPGTNLTFTPFGNLAQGIPAFNGPDLTSGVVDMPGTASMRTPYGGPFHRGYIQSWNLFIERNLINDIKVEVGYVGTQTTHQLAAIQANTAEPGGQQPFSTKYGRTADTLLFDGFLSANYHALQIAVNRRYSNGLFIKGAYTLSKAINMTNDTGTDTLTYNSPSAISRNRALAGYDIPHNLQLGASYELPFGKGKKWAGSSGAAAIFGGWQVSPTFSSVMGRPFSVTASTASLADPGTTAQNPDQVGEVIKLGGVGPGEPFYDPNAFKAVTGTPRFGTVGRNTLRGPGYVNLDLSLLRTFRIKERSTLDFRVDAFNFTNTPHFMNPASNISGGNFMIITSALPDQRQFRFGLRFGF